MYPTPRCHDAKKPCASELNRNSPCISSIIWNEFGRDKLMDATWCEYFIMGFPKGWTSLGDLNKDDYKEWFDFFKSKLLGKSDKIWVCENISPISDDNSKERMKRLVCIGNAQVPICAAFAFVLLLERYYNK